MKNGPFKVFIDRLKNDDTEQILETVDPDFLQIQEKELVFVKKILVSGQAYLAKNHLILDLKIKAKAKLPCSICNESVETPIEVDDFSHTVEICEVKSAIYDFSDEIREALLLKIPQFLECHHGHCPHRKDVNNYLKKPSKDTHSPFSELSL